MQTDWKPIPDWPYEASSDGRIRRSKPPHSAGGYTKMHRELASSFCNGYRVVTLSDGPSRRAVVGVHRVVAAAFFGPAPEGMQAAHRDGDRENNKADNLRWATAKDNAQDKYDHGTILAGERSPNAVLTDDLVRKIRARYDALSGAKPFYGFWAELQRESGVSKRAIMMAAKRETWRHLND